MLAPTRALLKSRSSACSDYLSIQESNGQSVKGVSAGSTAIVWTFQTAFLVRCGSRGNAQPARTPAHKRLFIWFIGSTLVVYYVVFLYLFI